MGKDLSEMTLEELWELFPIFLVAHDDRWKDNYNDIEKTLKLAGAVCDFTEPATGQNKLFFPVEREIQKDSYVYAILENDETD